MSEEWFWDSELRIVWNLIEEKKKIDKARMKNQAVYIASYVWGNDIDDEDEKPSLIPGIDIPANPEVINYLFWLIIII